MTPSHAPDPDGAADDDRSSPAAPRLRAGDEERDAVLDILAQAHGAGRLDPDEVDERQRATLHSRFVDELPALIEDLPEGRSLAERFALATGSPEPHPRRGPGTSLAHTSRGEIVPVAPGSGPPEQSIAIMSGREVHVVPGTATVRSYALMGSDEVYLTDVMGPGVEVTLESYAMWAGNEVYVPAGVKVIDRTVNIMAGNSIAKNARGDGSNGVLILTGFSLMAGHDVKLDPNWTPRGHLER
ncbi:DUF1707 SHOCT-like domain-containing protein [Brevibacterium yomogidense]|uniref:DUF1707 SHOCT-like domain-containing protein n=1 Tax=Brevibacterium yomogidense TaxID=946573 RepID=UPI0018DF8A49|nr:DUF1707 domain-containing protein [Brevibacterium yomogidense]